MRTIAEDLAREAALLAIGPDGSFIGMGGFGASAPGPDLYQCFGLTVEAIVSAAPAVGRIEL